MEADAHPESPANLPLARNHRAQGRVVRIRRVLLEPEGWGDEVHRHAEHVAQSEHDRGCIRRGQPGQFVNGELAQIAAAFSGSKGGFACSPVFVIALLHLEHRRPDPAEQPFEFRGLQRQPRLRDAGPHLLHQVRCDGRQPGRLAERQFGREVECDVARQQTAPDKGILTRIVFAANRLVVCVETPGQLAAMEPGLEL